MLNNFYCIHCKNSLVRDDDSLYCKIYESNCLFLEEDFCDFLDLIKE